MYSQYDSTLKPKKTSYIAALDGIRAIAILLVLFSHSVIFDQFIWLHNIGLKIRLSWCFYIFRTQWLSDYAIANSGRRKNREHFAQIFLHKACITIITCTMAIYISCLDFMD